MDLGVMTMKEYFTLLRTSEMKPHHQKQFNAIPKTLIFEEIPLLEIQWVYFKPYGQEVLRIGMFILFQIKISLFHSVFFAFNYSQMFLFYFEIFFISIGTVYLFFYWVKCIFILQLKLFLNNSFSTITFVKSFFVHGIYIKKYDFCKS